MASSFKADPFHSDEPTGAAPKGKPRAAVSPALPSGRLSCGALTRAGREGLLPGLRFCERETARTVEIKGEEEDAFYSSPSLLPSF